jgi:hypothetical protein
MAEKLYIARVVVETVVAHPTHELAFEGIKGDLDAGGPAAIKFHEIENMRQLPAGWDGGCIPWGGDGERPCRKILED